MASSPKSIRPAPVLEAAVAHNGGGHGLSHRLAEIGDRYMELLRRTDLPELTEGELNALRDIFNAPRYQPAALIRGALWLGVEDRLSDGLAEKWQIDGAALVETLRGLTFAQEVKLVEQIEGWWRRGGVLNPARKPER